MREPKEIVDMLAKVADCAGNEDEPCPFFDYCECTEEACYKQWEEWLNGN